MVFILQYLWFAVIPLGLVGVTLFKRRNDDVLQEKAVTIEEANSAYLMIMFAMVATAGGIGVVQLLGNISNPFFVYSGNLENDYVLAGKIVLGLFWVGLIIWAWFSNQFTTYAKLILPRKLSGLLVLAKPFATVVAITGISFLLFYAGNKVPFLILNFQEQPVEWVKIIADDKAHQIDRIPGRQQQMHSIPINGKSQLDVQYKLPEHQNPWQASLPFEVSEFSMGYVEIIINKDGKLRIGDKRLLP